VVVVDELLAVQNKSYDKPTILIAKRVKGEEEIPDGVVGVITPDMPDVLSHVSVRARNCKVCLFCSQLYCNLYVIPFFY
jgi:alpha-glucan, water dikinase